MDQENVLPHLFRTEYHKIISVLCKLFGFEHIETAEDIVSETFLMAAETWGIQGLPENPTAWLYTVSKNKTRDYLRRSNLFAQKIIPEIKENSRITSDIIEIDLSGKNISDSQLQMMFAICHPCISTEAQIALSLNILCGFGAEEIANALLTNRDAIYKKLVRAKKQLAAEMVKIQLPPSSEIENRLETVLTTLYLLFSEGYYSTSQNNTLRKELCVEAMRLNLMLLENESTNTPDANALLSLMCFHSSRFEARINLQGGMILYGDQDERLWNRELIEKGTFYLNKSSAGNKLSKYHLEAAIAYWHTHKEDTAIKWEQILQLYNKLLQIEYSPLAALNRTYALSKANSTEEAIYEAEKLGLVNNHFYYTLLGELYRSIDKVKARHQFETALNLAKTLNDKRTIQDKIDSLI